MLNFIARTASSASSRGATDTHAAGAAAFLSAAQFSMRPGEVSATEEHRMLCRALGMFLAMAERGSHHELHLRAENLALMIENFSRPPPASQRDHASEDSR